MTRFQQLAAGALVALATWVGAAGAASAHGLSHPRASSDRIDARQDRQADRIRHGVRSGHLTRAEAHDLMHQQQRIRQAELRARADGRVDARERQRLDMLQDRAGRDIARQMRDRQAS